MHNKKRGETGRQLKAKIISLLLFIIVIDRILRDTREETRNLRSIVGYSNKNARKVKDIHKLNGKTELGK